MEKYFLKAKIFPVLDSYWERDNTETPSLSFTIELDCRTGNEITSREQLLDYFEYTIDRELRLMEKSKTGYFGRIRVLEAYYQRRVGTKPYLLKRWIYSPRTIKE